MYPRVFGLRTMSDPRSLTVYINANKLYEPLHDLFCCEIFIYLVSVNNAFRNFWQTGSWNKQKCKHLFIGFQIHTKSKLLYNRKHFKLKPQFSFRIGNGWKPDHFDVKTNLLLNGLVKSDSRRVFRVGVNITTYFLRDWIGTFIMTSEQQQKIAAISTKDCGNLKVELSLFHLFPQGIFLVDPTWKGRWLYAWKNTDKEVQMLYTKS